MDRFSLPATLPPQVAAATVIEKLGRDKKFAGGNIRFVVLEALGRARVTGDLFAGDLRAAVAALRA